MNLIISVILALLASFALTSQVERNHGVDTPLTETEYFVHGQNLSDQNIKCVIRDSVGYLWIGTQNGLNKYDGARVTKYYANPNDPASIPDNYIQLFFVDSDGDLWVLVPGSFCRYNENTDSFTSYIFTDKKKNTHTSNPGYIVQDSDGTIWIGTPEQGLYSFDKTTCTFEFRPLTIQNIDYMTFDNDGNLWIGSPGRVYVYNVGSNTYKELYVPNDDVVVSITPAENLLITRNNFYEIRSGNGSIEFVRLDTNIPQIECEVLYALELDDYFLLGTRESGLLKYSLKHNTLETVSFGRYIPNDVSRSAIRCLYEDRYGIVWICTESGLNYIYPNKNHFEHYSSIVDTTTLVSNLVSAFAEDSTGKIWISTYEGVSVYDPDTKVFDNIKYIKTKYGKMHMIENLRDIYIASDQSIWLLQKNCIIKYDPVSRIGEPIYLKYNNIDAQDLLCIFIDENTIWVGTYGYGVFHLNKETGDVIDVFNTENSDISADYIKDIIRLDNSNLCFATLRTGIDIYNPTNREFENIHFSGITKNYVSDYINAVFTDSRHNIWVLSWHEAFVLNDNAEIIRQISTDNGTLTNEMNAICEDNNGSIWIGTANGLSQIFNYDTDDFHIGNYTTDDGIAYNIVSTGSLYKSKKDGTIYVGTLNGLNIFSVSDMAVDTTSEAPIITALLISNEEVKPGAKIDGQVIIDKPLHLQPEVVLSHYQNSISLIFANLDLAKVNDRRYSYIMEGIDQDWSYSDDNVARYNYLSPGKYRFRVKAKNKNGIWSPETVLDIEIQLPWWRSPLAMVIYTLLFLAIIYFVIRFLRYRDLLHDEVRISKIERDKENEIHEIKQRLYSNVSHDMRTALTLISGPIYTAIKHERIPDDIKENFRVVEKNIDYLLSLIDQVLDFRQIDTGQITPKIKEIELVSYIKNIVDMFSSYAELKQIHLECSSSEKQITAWIDKTMMAKVFYNLISNALKFTPADGRVTITSEIEDDNIVIKIADTGVGMESSQIGHIFEEFYQAYSTDIKHTKIYSDGNGIGLSIVKNYVELHHGTIRVDSEYGKGSTFIVTLPQGNESFEQIDESGINEDNDMLPTPHMVPISINNISVDSTSVMNEPDDGDLEKKQTVLVVDDNPDIINYLKSFLSSEFNVYAAYNGVEGMSEACRLVPDVIVSDVMMPQEDGFVLAKKLKNNEFTRHIPILFLTAKTSYDDVLQGLSYGAVDYLTKPFNEDVFLAKIKSLIFDRNAFRENLRQQFENKMQDSQTDSLVTSLSDSLPISVRDVFFEKIVACIAENVENSSLSADFIANKFSMSRMQLYRKLKAVSGLTASDLIREMRLRRSEELLAKTDLNISEIAYRLEFSDPFHFSKMFKKRNGCSPSQYRKTHSASS